MYTRGLHGRRWRGPEGAGLITDYELRITAEEVDLVRGVSAEARRKCTLGAYMVDASVTLKGEV